MNTGTSKIKRVSEWKEVEVKQYNWNNDYPLLDLEIVFYEADGEYEYKGVKQVFPGAYVKYYILNNDTGYAHQKEFEGESAYHNSRRESSDFIYNLIIKKDKP